MTHLKSIVGPTTEFELTFLVIEGEPGDVNFASALEDTRWQVIATAITPHHHIRLVRAVKLLIRTNNKEQTKRKFNYFAFILTF